MISICLILIFKDTKMFYITKQKYIYFTPQPQFIFSLNNQFPQTVNSLEWVIKYVS